MQTGGSTNFLCPDSFTSSRSLNRLLLNRGDGTFGLSVEGAVGSDRLLVNGASWADYDNDGDPDLFLANVLDDNNQHLDRLYQNDGHARFTSVTNTPLVQSPGATYHSAWGDFDNDGDFDCVVTKRSGVALLFINDAGSFSRPSITLPAPSGGPSWIDYDNDGYLDLFMDRGQGKRPDQRAAPQPGKRHLRPGCRCHHHRPSPASGLFLG